MAAHLIQAKIFFHNTGMGVVARSAHMWGADQHAFGGIAPRMIGAPDRAFDGFGFAYQLHASVTADVFKDPEIAILVAQQQQGDSQEADGFGITGIGHISAHGQTGPCGL